MTRTTLEVLELLSSEFNTLSSKGLVLRREVLTSAYTVINDTGVDVRLVIGDDEDEAVFVLVKEGVKYGECILKPGTSVALALKENCDMTTHHSSVLREQEGRLKRLLKVEVIFQFFCYNCIFYLLLHLMKFLLNLLSDGRVSIQWRNPCESGGKEILSFEEAI